MELSEAFGVLPGVRLIRMRILALAVFFIAGALAACGTPDAQPGRTIARGAVIQHSGNYSITVHPAEFTAGQKVEVTVTISGPMRYQFGCVTPLKIHIADTNGNEIWNPPYNPRPCKYGEAGPPIGWAQLQAGQTMTFSDAWPSSAHLTNGTYYLFTTFMLATEQSNLPHELPAVKVKIVSPQT
jgi:hypothetical protein